MFYSSTIRGSTVPLLDVPLFHHPCSTFPPSDATQFHDQMFYCSTTRCSTVPLFPHLCSTVPPSACNVLPSDVKVFWHQVFYCSTARAVGCFTVPPLDVLLFHYQLFHCSTMCSSLRCSIVPPSRFYCFSMIVLLLHHLCSLSLREGLCTEKNKGFSSSWCNDKTL